MLFWGKRSLNSDCPICCISFFTAETQFLEIFPQLHWTFYLKYLTLINRDEHAIYVLFLNYWCFDLFPPAWHRTRSLAGPLEKRPGQSHVHPRVCSWWKWHLFHIWARSNHIKRGRLTSTQVGRPECWVKVIQTNSNRLYCKYDYREVHVTLSSEEQYKQGGLPLCIKSS